MFYRILLYKKSLYSDASCCCGRILLSGLSLVLQWTAIYGKIHGSFLMISIFFNLNINYELNQLVESQFSYSFSTSCHKCKHAYNRFCVLAVKQLLNDASASKQIARARQKCRIVRPLLGPILFSLAEGIIFLHTSVVSFQVAFKRKHYSYSVLYSYFFILNGFHICCLASSLLICDQETGILLCH